VHSAKGREFDAVALVDLHDGRIPHFTAQSADEFAEARRLFYVAVTRPRKVLMYFTDTSNRRNTPTRFLGPRGLGLVR
jgi:DNA helicase-2/ATP-dependent DNA helicase PcrA